jgi:catechol-2,3-dioxygenase
LRRRAFSCLLYSRLSRLSCSTAPNPDGRDEFHFQRVNRHAVYFADPAGNILELIARHNLKDGSPGRFSLTDVLYVNHFGFVVDDVMKSIEQIRKALHLQLRQPPVDTFAQLGDEHRHLVLVSRERLWLPEGTKPAKVFSSEVVLHGIPERRMELDGYPYRVSVQA